VICDETLIPDRYLQCRFGARLILALSMLRGTTFLRTMHTLLIAVTLLVSLRPAHAQSTSMATVLGQQGNLSVFKEPNSTYQTPLFVGNQVRAGQIIVTGVDGYGKFQVQDGSTFEVFPDARVIFHPTMNFLDLLNVVIGKVKVHIQHMQGIPNPNNVTTPTALISVRGTTFMVDVQDEEGTTTVSVDEGQVSVKHLKQAGNIILLNPGEARTVDPRSPLANNRDIGGALYKLRKIGEDAIREIIFRNPGGSSTPGGGPTTTPGQQGDKDKGKPTSGTGTGTPSGTGAGGPPAPPAPPAPPGGGGGQ
jgi:hypothetical protein